MKAYGYPLIALIAWSEAGVPWPAYGVVAVALAAAAGALAWQDYRHGA